MGDESEVERRYGIRMGMGVLFEVIMEFGFLL